MIDLDELELEVERLVAGGEGLGRFEGIPIFVPRSAPGDRLRVRLTERRPDYGRAEIVEILEPGPDRRQPPCPYFARCGGCDLQHIEDRRQLTLKAEAVRETLRRIGGIEMPPQVAIEAGQPWGYRLRTQLHIESGAGEVDEGGDAGDVGDAGDAGDAGRVEIGYFARGSRELVAIDRCPILAPELERLLPQLPAALAGEGRRRLDLALGDGGAWTTAPMVAGLPHGPVSLEVGAHTYRYDARCFFQAHRGLVATLVEHAVGPWTGGTAYDLYAGVGLFALPLAGRYDTVHAVEGDRIAARYARINARENKVSVEVTAQSVDTWIASLPAAVDRVLVDPPRAGLSAAVRGIMLRQRPRRITYVSCHAATLARDLRFLGRAYEIERMALLDLFPQTGHMEVVAQLALRDRADRDGEDSEPTKSA